MSTLQNSKLNDQRGLLTKADLEIPDFLKLQPPASNSNANNNCNNVTEERVSSPAVVVVENDPARFRPAPLDWKVTCATYGEKSRREPAARGRSKPFVELSSHPRTLRTFKPSPVSRPSTSSGSNFEPDDTNDTTIVEDTDFVSKFASYDAEMTLCPLPTPPRSSKEVEMYDWSMADFSPPTPIARDPDRKFEGDGGEVRGRVWYCTCVVL